VQGMGSKIVSLLLAIEFRGLQGWLQ